MIDYFKAILTRQFEASLCMLDKCIRECQPAHWESKIANGTVRQVAYHTLYYGYLYLYPSLEAFEPTEFHHRGGLRPAGVTTCIGLTKDETQPRGQGRRGRGLAPRGGRRRCLGQPRRGLVWRRHRA